MSVLSKRNISDYPTRKALRNTLETGWTVLTPHTNLAAKLKEFRCLQRDRVPDEGLVLRQFALGSLWADESAGFAFCRSGEALFRKGESLFKLGTLPGQFPVTRLSRT
jgi:hypothetical protein